MTDEVSYKPISGPYNLKLRVGKPFGKHLTIKDGAKRSTATPVDLTDYTAVGYIVASKEDTLSGPHLADFTCTFDEDLTTGKLTVSLLKSEVNAIRELSVVTDFVADNPHAKNAPVGHYYIFVQSPDGLITHDVRGDISMDL